jgi:hypothetical protein
MPVRTDILFEISGDKCVTKKRFCVLGELIDYLAHDGLP